MARRCENISDYKPQIVSRFACMIGRLYLHGNHNWPVRTGLTRVACKALFHWKPVFGTIKIVQRLFLAGTSLKVQKCGGSHTSSLSPPKVPITSQDRKTLCQRRTLRKRKNSRTSGQANGIAIERKQMNGRWIIVQLAKRGATILPRRSLSGAKSESWQMGVLKCVCAS